MWIVYSRVTMSDALVRFGLSSTDVFPILSLSTGTGEGGRSVRKKLVRYKNAGADISNESSDTRDAKRGSVDTGTNLAASKVRSQTKARGLLRSFCIKEPVASRITKISLLNAFDEPV